jgi:uncharacterized membrane protein SpoIIM required for sporulation
VTRDELVKSRKKRWDRLLELLYQAERGMGPSRLGPAGISELAEIYRALAGDLMLVRRDKLGADLERYLDNLASRAHNALYAGTAVGTQFKIHTLLLDFAPALRRNLRFFLIAFALFFGPGALAGTAAYLDETYALAVLSPDQLRGMEQMHGEGHEGKGRDGDTNAGMTGFYVQHNVSIAFTCFATGILFGLGPIFYLLFNGIAIGVVMGHLARTGFGPNIFSFISSHSPWELTAIVISGAAGLQMGYALVSTRGRTRLGNLQAHGLELLRQVAGAAAFLAIAAMIEAWYSPSSLPNEVKYATGFVGWILVFAIIAFLGRDRPTPPDVRELLQGVRA